MVLILLGWAVSSSFKAGTPLLALFRLRVFLNLNVLQKLTDNHNWHKHTSFKYFIIMEKENKSQFYNFLKIKQRFNNIGQVWHSTSFLEKRNKKEIYLGAFPFILTPYINSLHSHFDHFIIQSVYNWRDEPRADYSVFTSFSGLPINNRYGKKKSPENLPNRNVFTHFKIF